MKDFSKTGIFTGIVTVFLFAVLGFSPRAGAQEDALDRLRGEGILPADRQPAAEKPARPEYTIQQLEKMTISELDVVGNVSLSRSEIISQVQTRSGQLFLAQAAEEDAGRIAELEGVEYAYYNTRVVDGQVKLTYVVVEQNLIRNVVIDGNRRLSDSKLLSETGIRVGDYLDIFKVRNSVVVMQELYREKGYPFARVRLDDSRLNEGQVVYDIEEGPRTKIKKIEFRGNKALSPSALMSAIESRVRQFFFWPGYYKVNQVQEDVDGLIDAYQSRGYLDVQVDSQVSLSEDRKGATLTFDIEEGSQYITEQITIQGNAIFQEQTLLEEPKLVEGEFFSRQKAEFDQKKILTRYLAQGYVNAEVSYEYTYPEPQKVSVIYQIEPGSRFKIGYITITGNENTQDKVIRRVLDEEGFTPGQWYDADAARGDGEGELETRLRQRVYTPQAIISPTGEDPNTRNALVSVVEGQTGSILFGAGIASDNGLIGQVIFDQRNFDIFDWPEKFSDIFNNKGFRGAGQRLRLSIEPGTEQTRFSGVFTEPFLYDMPVALTLGGSGFERERESFDEIRLKAFASLEKRYKDDWRRGVSFRLENVEVGEVDFDAPQEIKDVSGDNLLAGFRFFIGKDTTDSPYLPSRGYNFDTGYEQVSGDYNFGILSATQRWYKTLYEDFSGLKTVLETKVHGATVIGDAPPFEKFYAGGIGTLRGFEYRGVSTRGEATAGPKVKKDPIGSDWIMLANAEVAIPLGNETFSILFFSDNGLIDSGGLRSSVGTGIQILIPQWFGPVPMRFELATPIMKDDLDDTQIFSFSVGALF